MRETVGHLLKLDDTYDYNWEGIEYYTGEYDEEEHQIVLTFNCFSDSEFRSYVRTHYSNREYDDYDPDTNGDIALLANFKKDFTQWKSMREDQIAVLLYALYLKYNPIENYHGTEKVLDITEDTTYNELSFDDRKDTSTDDSFIEHSFNNYKETEKKDETNTKSYTNYVETDNHAQQTHTDMVSADDASPFVNSKQGQDAAYIDTHGIAGSITDTATTGTNGNTKEISGNWKDTHGYTTGNVLEKSGTEKNQKGGTITLNHVLEKFGNLGVTTTQQMIESSFELAKKCVAEFCIDEFIKDYTFISLEVDE